MRRQLPHQPIWKRPLPCSCSTQNLKDIPPISGFHKDFLFLSGVAWETPPVRLMAAGERMESYNNHSSYGGGGGVDGSGVEIDHPSPHNYCNAAVPGFISTFHSGQIKLHLIENQLSSVVPAWYENYISLRWNSFFFSAATPQCAASAWEPPISRGNKYCFLSCFLNEW